MCKVYFSCVFFFSSICLFAQLSSKLDSLLRPISNKPGFALLIERDGKVLYQKADGLANITTGKKIDLSSNFRMASVSKQFTAMGILLLQKAHLLSLEDQIGKYLPELPHDIGSHVLIRHLLTHSSGIIDYEELIPKNQKKQILDADVLQLLKHHDTTYFPPGTKFLYSNSGFCLLSLIIERISGESFSSFISKKIFYPLQMNNSYVYENGAAITNRVMGYSADSSGKIIFNDQSVTSATKGDGGIYTSMNDYIKWIHALQQNKFLNLNKIMQRIRVSLKTGIENYYAAGWFETGLHNEILFHSGSTSGFNNYVIEVPKQKFSVIYFSNKADNEKSFKAITGVIKQSGLGDFSEVFKLYNLTN